MNLPQIPTKFVIIGIAFIALVAGYSTREWVSSNPTLEEFVSTLDSREYKTITIKIPEDWGNPISVSSNYKYNEITILFDDGHILHVKTPYKIKNAVIELERVK